MDLIRLLKTYQENIFCLRSVPMQKTQNRLLKILCCYYFQDQPSNLNLDNKFFQPVGFIHNLTFNNTKIFLLVVSKY